MTQFKVICSIIMVLAFTYSTLSLPVIEPPELPESDDVTTEKYNVTVNGTQKDLYVIKAIVYEIGILTDVDENDNSTEDELTHERVDLTFFDAHSNASHFDLGDIPLPVSTNVSGQVLTGIAPVHIGAVQTAQDILSTLPLTGTIVNISQSETSIISLKHNETKAPVTFLSHDNLAQIPSLSDSLPILIDNPDELQDAERDD